MPYAAFAEGDCRRVVLVVTDDEALASWLRDAMPGLAVRPLSSADRPGPVKADGSVVIVDAASLHAPAELERCVNAGPVLVLFRERDAARVAQVLEAGAADTMCAPYLVEELRARIARLLQHAASRSQPLGFAGRWYDRIRREVSDNQGRRQRLTPSESIVMESLIEAAGAVVSRDALLRRIAAEPLQIKSNLVDRHVATLRAKLGDDPRNPRCVATVPGRGYRLSGVASRITAS